MIASDAGPVDRRQPSRRNLPALQRELPGLPVDADGPVFKAPWEAQAFALALTLHERGAFTWKEWAQTLAAVIGEVTAARRARHRRATTTGTGSLRSSASSRERAS